MKIYDITLTVTPEMVVWPGDEPVMLERIAKIEEGSNHNGSHMAMGVHTGTHVDAPYHFVADGRSVDHLDLDVLIGSTQVIHLPDAVDGITAEVLHNAGLMEGVQRVAFRTRNSALWANPQHPFEREFVAISEDGAEELVRRGVRLVAVDYLSVAPYHASVPTHVTLLEAGVVVVEGVNLAEVPAGVYRLICLPIKLGGADGAPARVVLIAE